MPHSKQYIMTAMELTQYLYLCVILCPCLLYSPILHGNLRHHYTLVDEGWSGRRYVRQPFDASGMAWSERVSVPVQCLLTEPEVAAF